MLNKGIYIGCSLEHHQGWGRWVFWGGLRLCPKHIFFASPAPTLVTGLLGASNLGEQRMFRPKNFSATKFPSTNLL